MALFGIDFYGATRYGPRVYLDFDASPLRARAVGRYGSLYLDWNTPVGQWSELRLVRNSYGTPVSQDDGVVLVSSQSGPAVAVDREAAVRSYQDDNLEGDRFQYYAIWLYVPGVDEWTRAAEAIGLPLRDHGYSNRLWQLTPSILRTKTTGLLDADNEELRSFEQMFGYQLDQTRGGLETLRDLNDPHKVSGNLLPLMAQQWGQFFEPELGMKQMRTLLRETVHLYRNKGTIPGVEGFVSALSGYGAKVRPLKNLMLDYNDSSAEESVGRWWSGGGQLTATRYVADGIINAVPDAIGSTMRAVGLFKFTATGVHVDARVECGLYDNAGGLRSIPITAGTTYTFSAYGRAETGTLALRLFLFWVDRAGNYMGEVNNTAAPQALDATSWTRGSVTAVAPTGATYAAVGVGLANTTTGQVLYIDAMQLEAGDTATAYEDARLIDIDVIAPRVNTVPNPSFEVDTASWTGEGHLNLLTENQSSAEADGAVWITDGTATTSRSTAQALHGTTSLALTKTGATGSMYAYTNERTTVTGGQVYTVVSHVRAATAGRAISAYIAWHRADGSFISGASGALSADHPAGWTQVRYTAQAPLDATKAIVSTAIDGCAVGEVHYVDAIGLFADPAGNLVPNPDFENGTTGWSVDTGATIAASVEQSYTGRQSMKVTKTATDAYPRNEPGTIVPVAGMTYTASVWARSDSAITMRLYMNYAGQSTGSEPVTLTPNVWTRLTYTTTAPTNPTYLQVFPAAEGNFPAATYYVDAVQVVVGSSPVDYLPPTTANLVTNPSFEVDTTGWAAAGPYATALTRETSGGYIGAAFLRTASNGAGDAGIAMSASGYDMVPVAPGQILTVSAYVRTSATAASARFFLEPQSFADSAYVGNIADVEFPVSASWTRITCTVTVPANTRHLRVYAGIRGESGATFDLDAVQVEYGSVATPYVDGSLGAGYSWEASENLLTAAQSNFEDGSTGGWSANNTTIANTSAQAAFGTYSLAATAANTSNANGVYTVLQNMPAGSYTISAYLRSSVAVDVQFGSDTYPGTLVTVPVGTGGWVRATATINHTGGPFAIVAYRNTGVLVGDVLYIDAVQVEQKDHATAYGATGAPNASTSKRQTPWSLGGEGTTRLVRTDEVDPPISEGGSWVLRVDNVEGDTSGAVTAVTLEPFTTYTASAYCRVGVGDIAPQLRVFETGLAGTELGVTDAVTVDDAWERLSLTFTTGASGAVSVEVRASAPATPADSFYVDAVLLEKGSELKGYFDGSTYAFIGDSIWEGDGNNSPSYYYPQRRAKNYRLNALLPDYTPMGSSFRVNYAAG